MQTEILELLHLFTTDNRNWVFSMKKTNSNVGKRWYVEFGAYKETGELLLPTLEKLKERVYE